MCIRDSKTAGAGLSPRPRISGKIGRLLNRLALGLLGLDFLHGVLVREVPAALLVDLHKLDPHHVAHLAGVLHLFNAVVCQLGDVAQACLLYTSRCV